MKIDAAKARARLHWQPRLSIDQALAWTVDWYKQQAAGADMHALSLEQIKHYEGIAK